MAQYWIDVEDDPDIIDAEIDEALEVLENVELIKGHDTDDDDDVGESNDLMVVDNTEVLPAVISFLEAEQYLQALQQYSRSIKLPTKDAALLDKYGRLLRAHRLARPKSSPTLLSFFSSVPKWPSAESQQVPSTPNEARRTLHPLRGLKNQNNRTCYLNATLQMLYSCFDFMNSLRATEYGPGAPLISAVCLTYYDVKCRLSSVAINPLLVMDEIDTEIFAEHKQHDAQEFLTYVLDCIHGELKQKAPQGNDRPVPTDDFCMIVEQCLTCRNKNCGYSR
jgi:ubiquitin C-terminal hydrolase